MNILLRRILPILAPSLRIRMPIVEPPQLYLTFDDGPHPDTTPWILDTLELYQAQATFFVLGSQVEAHPSYYHMIDQSSHSIGIHGYHHLSAWHTSRQIFFDDLYRASRMIPSSLYRPPYGRLWPHWIPAISKHFDIYLWHFMPYDFLPNLDVHAVIEQLPHRIVSSSIIVLHDHPRAIDHLRTLLPAILRWGTDCGYRFALIPPRISNDKQFHPRF